MYLVIYAPVHLLNSKPCIDRYRRSVDAEHILICIDGCCACTDTTRLTLTFTGNRVLGYVQGTVPGHMHGMHVACWEASMQVRPRMAACVPVLVTPCLRYVRTGMQGQGCWVLAPGTYILACLGLRASSGRPVLCVVRTVRLPAAAASILPTWCVGAVRSTYVVATNSSSKCELNLA